VLRENGFLLLKPCPKVVYESEKRLPRSVPDWQSLQQTYNRLKKSSHYWEQRDYAIIDLAYSCGLRRGELHSLNVDDIEQQDPDNVGTGSTIRVKGKGGRERVVTVGPHALKDLLYYVYHIRPKFLKSGTTKALFVSRIGGGQRMNARSINEAFGRLRSKYGFGRSFAPHNLRHAFATDLIRHGAPVSRPVGISRMLGHKKLETTQVYTRLVPMDLKRCHARYHPRGE
jgi:integrase/recombinase XerD